MIKIAKLILITCIWCVDAGLQMHTPLPNSCQCTVPHGKMAWSWVSREYLPGKNIIGIDLSASILLTCSTTPVAHQPPAFCQDLQTAPRASCRTVQSLWLYPCTRKLVKTSRRSESGTNVWWAKKQARNGWLNLCGNVSYWGRSNLRHSMNSCISRVSGLSFFFHWTGRREYMLVCLCTKWARALQSNINGTCRYKECTAKKSVPQILRVILVFSIQK